MMNFDPVLISKILNGKGIKDIYHANTVTTSCSMLRLGALCSRENVESQGEPQTVQASDEIDKKYGIWDCVFLDTTDIHRGVSRLNHYGPVLFRFSKSLLLQTAGSGVRVTKSNPTGWSGLADEDRWFTTEAELEESYNPSDYGQMLVLPAPALSLAFDPQLQSIILDNPKAKVKGSDAFVQASDSLMEAARASGVPMPEIQERTCIIGCSCIGNYNRSYPLLYKFFLPRMGT